MSIAIGQGLTTTKSAFIENAQKSGELYIKQPYELYSEANQETWRVLYARLKPKWEKYANSKFLEGVENLMLSPDLIPNLDEINSFLKPLSGFSAKAVSGYVPAYLFFDCLRNRSFPTTVTIRDSDALDYLPEPDIFHDVAGHVPMHTDRKFSDVLVRFGEVAQFAAVRAKSISKDKSEVAKIVESNIKAMARFFWFTVEFGLMREKGEIKAYGSGILSSASELQHAIESQNVQRFDIQLEWVINQHFEIDKFQPLYFIVDSFDHLFGLVDGLEMALRAGKLDNVCPGEPVANPADLASFLDAKVE